MEQFPDASTYWQHLKSLSDQLSNVGASVSNERLVLQLIFGLTNAYATVGSQIRHEDSLPPFTKLVPMIILEETTKAKKAANSISNSVFVSSLDDNAASITPSQQCNHRNNNNSGAGRGGRNNGRGRGRNNGCGGVRSQPQQHQWLQLPSQQPQWTTPTYPR